MMGRNANTALWLIGLGVLALTGWWWPGILFLVALSALVQGSFQGFIWLAGIGLLALTDFWWPGILIVAGFALLVRGLRGQISPPEERPEILFPEAPRSDPVTTEAEDPVLQPPASEPASAAPATPELGDLPATCPACGGPINGTTVQWRGSRASCGFCGTSLQST